MPIERITYSLDELDEIVATDASIHLERMNDGHVWLAIRSDGREVMVNLLAHKHKVISQVEES